jgi:glycosyltransferase involved in cell wall biosynthesis
VKRLLIFAQTPPPLHGQSLMAGELLRALSGSGQENAAEAGSAGDGSAALVYCHVNPRISEDLGDIGRWRARKLLLVFRYIATAVAARFRHRLATFYFVPAPAKRAAMYRDWVVLSFCRLFYRHLILHWHCIGQPEFIEEELSGVERFLMRRAYGRADLSICVTNFSREEAAYFRPRRIAVVANGLPDPCPGFDEEVWPEREVRAARFQRVVAGEIDEPLDYQVLFLAGRMTPKGLFDAMAAVTQANRRLAARGNSLRLRLTVAGTFADATEQERFKAATRELDQTRRNKDAPSLVVEAGWADEAKKRQLYRAADCFLFPPFLAESFGLVLVEAMAHGCAVVTTRWQGVPEVLPAGYPHLVEPHDVAGMAAALLACAAQPADRSLRDYFLARFTDARFRAEIIRVLSSS